MTVRTAAVAVVILCGACSSSSTSPTPGVDVSIRPNASNLGSAAFAPSTFDVSVAAGGTVHWRNADVGTSGDAYGMSAVPGTVHQLVSDTPGIFGADPIQPGALFEHTFTVAGTVHYHCAIHPTMTGTIVVGQ
jgi:plastocyanin